MAESNFPAEMAEETFPAKKKLKKDIFEASSTPTERLFQLVYKYNKSFEIHVKREVIRFENGNVVFPQKYLEGFPESFLQDEGFKTQADNFIIKVKGE